MVDSAQPLDSIHPREDSLVIYGCGTQGRAIIEFVRESGRYGTLRLTDDNRALWGSEIAFIPVRSPIETFAAGAQRFVCAIGDNRIRCAISRCLETEGHSPETVRQESAIVAPSACLGDGCILMARVVVNTEARVGKGCLLNTACVVEHHCEVGAYAHLAPGVLLGGGVNIGKRAMLGLGAIVLPGLRVGADAVVGAGAVVIRDVPPSTVVAGNPARVLTRATPSR